jgi:RNA polymerase sigma-70 factor (ECF subfamily)
VDRDLVEQAQAGDRDAFAVLARASADRMFAIAQRILRDVGRAEDAVQQTLVIAWRQLPRLRDPDRFDAWLRRLLVNACYDESRRHRRHASNIRLLPDHDRPTADSSGALADRDELDQAMRQLSTDHRAVIVHHYFLELALAEIADALGIPVGTAKSRLHNARLALRAAMAADGSRSEGHIA